MNELAYKKRLHWVGFCALAGAVAAATILLLSPKDDSSAAVAAIVAIMVPATWLAWRLIAHGIRPLAASNARDAELSWSLFDFIWGGGLWVLGLSNMAIAADSLFKLRLIAAATPSQATVMAGVGIACLLPAYELTALGMAARRRWRREIKEQARIDAEWDQKWTPVEDRIVQALWSALIATAAMTALIQEVNAGHVGLGLVLPGGVVALMGWRALRCMSSIERKIEAHRRVMAALPPRVIAMRPKAGKFLMAAGTFVLASTCFATGSIMALAAPGWYVVGGAALAVFGLVLGFVATLGMMSAMRARRRFETLLDSLSK
ncbi:hypothetical protein PLCT1_01710 [Planctomycetaceae bacterium]|nr:hypothetical protein PLCT1_01710 [Planctomycetaceae bacterium]